MTYYTRASLDRQPIDRWLADTLSRDAPPQGGSWQGAPKVEAQTANIANAQRGYRDAGGAGGFAIYIAVSIDQSAVRLARWVVNSAATAKRHADGAKALMAQLSVVEKAGAANEQRAVRIDAEPPSVKGLRAGGALVPGKYEGDVMRGKKFIRHITLLMHANGEYEYLQGSTNVDPHGKYKYQQATGRLDVSFGLLYNNTYHPDEDFCLFGRDASGAPVIYAEDHYGLGTFTVWLRRTGDVDRPPHSAGFALLPAAKGTTLSGQWSSSSSYSIPGGGGGSWSTWGVRLHADGRFDTFRSGGAGAGSAGSGVVVGAVYDDEGTVAAGSGPNFAVGSERKHANLGDRSGSYEIDGYNITLRFDNGSVRRQAFAVDDKRASLWFEGSLMSKR